MIERLKPTKKPAPTRNSIPEIGVSTGGGGAALVCKSCSGNGFEEPEKGVYFDEDEDTAFVVCCVCDDAAFFGWHNAMLTFMINIDKNAIEI